MIARWIVAVVDLEPLLRLLKRPRLGLAHRNQHTFVRNDERHGFDDETLARRHEKLAFEMIAFSVSEYFEVDSISSTCCLVWRLISMKFSTAFCSLIVGCSISIHKISS